MCASVWCAAHDEGGLWNTLMLAASVTALLELYRQDRSEPPRDIADLLVGHEDMLRVLPVAHCGWSDTAPVSEAAPTPRQMRASSYGDSLRRDAAD